MRYCLLREYDFLIIKLSPCYHREIKVHRKKVKKAVAKKNRDLADRLLNQPPTYKLDRLIIER
jgi:hypothetical protein